MLARTSRGVFSPHVEHTYRNESSITPHAEQSVHAVGGCGLSRMYCKTSGGTSSAIAENDIEERGKGSELEEDMEAPRETEDAAEDEGLPLAR